MPCQLSGSVTLFMIVISILPLSLKNPLQNSNVSSKAKWMSPTHQEDILPSYKYDRITQESKTRKNGKYVFFLPSTVNYTNIFFLLNSNCYTVQEECTHIRGMNTSQQLNAITKSSVAKLMFYDFGHYCSFPFHIHSCLFYIMRIFDPELELFHCTQKSRRGYGDGGGGSDVRKYVNVTLCLCERRPWGLQSKQVDQETEKNPPSFSFPYHHTFSIHLFNTSALFMII